MFSSSIFNLPARLIHLARERGGALVLDGGTLAELRRAGFPEVVVQDAVDRLVADGVLADDGDGPGGRHVLLIRDVIASGR